MLYTSLQLTCPYNSHGHIQNGQNKIPPTLILPLWVAMLFCIHGNGCFLVNYCIFCVKCRHHLKLYEQCLAAFTLYMSLFYVLVVIDDTQNTNSTRNSELIAAAGKRASLTEATQPESTIIYKWNNTSCFKYCTNW